MKVKTTAEQEAERKKQREEKAKKFTSVTNKIFEKVLRSYLYTAPLN